MSDATTVTYFAMRDTAKSQAREEDRAMAHAKYYSGDSLYAAQSALYVAMQEEATWLARPDYRSARSLRRAADMLDAANEVTTLVPEEGRQWSTAKLEAAGILWQIVRTEVPAR